MAATYDSLLVNTAMWNGTRSGRLRESRQPPSYLCEKSVAESFFYKIDRSGYNGGGPGYKNLIPKNEHNMLPAGYSKCIRNHYPLGMLPLPNSEVPLEDKINNIKGSARGTSGGSINRGTAANFVPQGSPAHHQSSSSKETHAGGDKFGKTFDSKSYGDEGNPSVRGKPTFHTMSCCWNSDATIGARVIMSHLKSLRDPSYRGGGNTRQSSLPALRNVQHYQAGRYIPDFVEGKKMVDSPCHHVSARNTMLQRPFEELPIYGKENRAGSDVRCGQIPASGWVPPTTDKQYNNISPHLKDKIHVKNDPDIPKLSTIKL